MLRRQRVRVARLDRSTIASVWRNSRWPIRNCRIRCRSVRRTASPGPAAATDGVLRACASLAHFRARNALLNFVVPTGNLGNAVACIMTRAMGLPIGCIVFSTNANQTLRVFFAGRDYAPRPSIATLANARDGCAEQFRTPALALFGQRSCGINFLSTPSATKQFASRSATVTRNTAKFSVRTRPLRFAHWRICVRKVHAATGRRSRPRTPRSSNRWSNL